MLHRYSSERKTIISPLLLGVFFGLFSGIVGTLVALAYFLPPQASTETGVPPRFGRAVTANDRPEWTDVRFGAAERAEAVFYPPSAGKIGAVAGAYAADDAVGLGVVLTSDGWVLSHADALGTDDPRHLIAVVDGKSYPVRAVARDGYSGTAFLKLDGANFAVASFGDDTQISSGDSLFVFDASHGIRRIEVIGLADWPARAAADYVQSSERVQQVFRVETVSGLLPGAAVVDRTGQMVGVYSRNVDGDAWVVPLSSFFGQIASILRDGKVSRPYLGVNYVDLSRLAVTSVDGAVRRGALLASSPDGRRPAVARRSPAETAGLRAGDIIIAVDDDEISAKRPLAELLAQYSAGGKITVTYRRGTVENSVDVTLGTAPAE